MANLITQVELDGLREDWEEALGTGLLGNSKTTIAITRTSTSNQGPIDPDTLKYSASTPVVVYTGEAHISPIVFRRDRQEIAGGETVRIRQYRCVLPFDSPLVKIDDVVEVVQCSDPHFAGRTMLVSDVMFESELSARRITLTDTTDEAEGNC